jgi:hypothetical protein
MKLYQDIANDIRMVAMQRYWVELLIAAYAVTSTDVIVTARGLLLGVGKEGNPFVAAVVPHTEPVLQILFITVITIISFWFIYLARQNVSVESMSVFYTKIISLGCSAAVGTHLIGILTWIL